MTLHVMLLLTLLQAGMAADHPMAPSCPTKAVPPPTGMEGWSNTRSITGGVNAATAVTIMVGSGVTATLMPTAKIAYAMQPEKPGELQTNGGIFAFVVPTPGRYRVALGSGAWIDVLGSGGPAASIAHGHGPDCTGIRKMVDFDLSPGRYLLQIAGNAGATLTLMVAHLR